MNPMQQVGNINELKMENLFNSIQFEDEPSTKQSTGTDSASFKLSYNNYCAVTQDFGTHHIDEETLKVLEGFGYPRTMVIRSLHKGELNHATTTYNLLVMA